MATTPQQMERMLGGLAGLSGNISDTAVPQSPTAAAALPSGACTRGVLLQASENNTDVVRWGASGVVVTSGGRLLPGDSVMVEVDNASDVFVVSASAGQTVAGVRI